MLAKLVLLLLATIALSDLCSVLANYDIIYDTEHGVNDRAAGSHRRRPTSSSSPNRAPSGDLLCPTIGAYSARVRRSEGASYDYGENVEGDATTAPTENEDLNEENFDSKIQYTVITIVDEPTADDRAGIGRPALGRKLKGKGNNKKLDYIILPIEQEKKNDKTAASRGSWGEKATCGDLVMCSNHKQCNGLACCNIPGTPANVCMKPLKWVIGRGTRR